MIKHQHQFESWTLELREILDTYNSIYIQVLLQISILLLLQIFILEIKNDKLHIEKLLYFKNRRRVK